MAAVNRYVVAVSGGVDSVVLLDVMQRMPHAELIVAHFDHGIRPDSQDDAAFVAALAKRHNLAFESRREILGEQAGEDMARQRRYAFLTAIAEKYHAKLVTAHHKDDLIETIAINHSRGTGWRGLVPMSGQVVRPLLSMDKQAIRDYALRHNLEWQEDSTNQTDAYLRNRLRRKLASMPSDKKKRLLELHTKQQHLKKNIEKEVLALIGKDDRLSRYFFIHIPDAVAIELLRPLTKARLTRPQLHRAVLAIKTSKPRTTYQAGNGVELHFTSRYFSVELIK